MRRWVDYLAGHAQEYLLDVLTRLGYADLAYEVVRQTTHPGWDGLRDAADPYK